MRPALKLLLFVLILAFNPLATEAQQSDMFKQKKERKKLWKRWRKDREAYNPYLKKKGKDKPSAKMAKGNKRELKRQKRAAKKQMRHNKRITGH